jgi:phage-related protein
MAGAFRIAEGYVEVTADESAYDRAMDRLRSRRYEVAVGLRLDSRDARTQLDRFTRDRSLRVRVNLDQTALSNARFRAFTVNVLPELQEAARRRAEQQLAALTRDRTVRIIADLDTRAAADDLALLTRARAARITASADTRAAADDLALLARRRTVNVRVDLDRSALSGLTGTLGGAGGGGESSAFGIKSLVSALTNLKVLAVGAAPSLASLGQAIIQMGPAAALAAPAVLSLGAAFAAVKLGTSGIGDAFKAAFAPATKSAGSAATATRQVESAQRSLAKAQQAVKDAEVNAAEARVKAARDIQDAQQSLKNTVQDVADANRRAAESVAGAERDLADAQRAAKQAQQDLTQARKDAAQELEDLNARLADAQLDQRQKVLDLQDAEQELAAVKAKGSKATQEELDKAQLQYDKAVQALSEQQTETARLQEQTDQANKAGVEGSDKVTKAKTEIVDANRKVVDQTRALKDAEIEAARAQQDGAQRVAKAQRDVADAQAAAAKAATDGARQIADAQEAAREAAQALAQAQNSGALATNKVADALARLAPNARAFVDAVIAQREAWRSLKLDVQNALFAGLGQKFTQLSGAVLPSLRAGLTGTATILNTTAKNAANAVIELAKTGQLRRLFDGLNAGMRPLTRIPGQIVTGLSQISIAASPAFARLTKAASDAADRISQKLSAAFKSGGLETAINNGVQIAKQFGKVLGDAFATVNNVLKAAAQGGGDALGALGSVFAELRRITAMPEVQKALSSIFQAVNAIAKLVAGTLGAVVQAVLPLLAKLAPVVVQLATKFGPLLADLASTLGKALMPIMDALLPVLSDVGDLIVSLVQAVMPLLQPIGTLLGAIVTALAPVLSAIGAALVPVVGALVQGLMPVVMALVPIVVQLGQFLGQMAPAFTGIVLALVPLLPAISELVVSLLNLALQVVGPLLPLIAQLASLMAGTLAGAIGILVPVITTVIGWITNLADAVTKVVKWIVDGFQWLYDKLVGHSIIPDMVKGIISWFTSLWTKTKEIFNQLKQGVIDRWNALWKAASDRWSSFWDGFRTAIGNAKTSVLNWVSGLKTSFTNTWSSMWTSAVSKVTSVFTTLRGKISEFKTSMLNSVKAIRDGIGNLWTGIQSKFATPVKWVVSHVYNNGLRKMWNSIAGKINSKISLPTISLGFNKGGVVPGTGNSDTVPAMLTPGERILSKQQVTKLGGHRGIDAILGQDQPTKTGGNPSRQEEKRRYQATPHFASGGIVGKVTGAVSGAVGSVASWAKDVVVGGLKAAAQKALASLVRPLINQIPGGNAGIGGLLKGLSNKAVDGMLGWLGNEDKKAVGGPAVQKALSWVKTQNGLPYQWAGNGNPSWDCSGLMSAIESVIRGERPHRRWATGSFVGNNGPAGWVRNLNSPFMIGVTNAGVGHTAGTLAGMNVESSGGAGVHMGKSARGYNNSLFTSRWGFAPAAKYDQGGLLADGATMVVKRTRKPERVLDPRQTELFEQLVTGGGGAAGSVTIEHFEVNIDGTLDLTNQKALKDLANSMPGYMNEALRKWNKERAR